MIKGSQDIPLNIEHANIVYYDLVYDQDLEALKRAEKRYSQQVRENEIYKLRETSVNKIKVSEDGTKKTILKMTFETKIRKEKLAYLLYCLKIFKLADDNDKNALSVADLIDNEPA